MFSLPMRGSFFDVFIFISPFLFASIFMGLTIAAFFKKREHALMVLLFSSIPIVFLSGFSWPTSAMPEWLLALAALFPSTPGIKGYLALTLRGAPFSDVIGNLQHIWILVVFYFITASILMRRVLRSSFEVVIEKKG